MIGRVVSHYRVVARIGAGGMGVVYKAEDMRLGRTVAIKVLSDDLASDPTSIERFRREARAASALNHPNICTVHEIDEVDGAPFFVMEFLEGETVRDALRHGRLPADRVVELAIELADALAAAHEAGVVHRDLKPANLFITRLGHLKILDFGLAKLVRAGPAELLSNVPTDPRGLTLANSPLGTVGYMSPEQARGEEIDHRSDLFSFGAVLYEVGTGTRPFEAPSVPLVFDAILHRSPEPAGVSAELRAIIVKALEKNRDLRFQSAADMRADLKRLQRETNSGGAVTTPQKRRLFVPLLAFGIALAVLAVAAVTTMQRRANVSPAARANRQRSLAVLPFSNLGSDRTHDYLRYALPDETITLLSYSPSLAVRPFAITRRVRDDADPQQTGRSLKVSDIVTGHFRTSGARLGVTLEAIDVEKNEIVWRDSIEGPVDDLIAMREQIAARIRTGLLPRLRASLDRGQSSRPNSDEAYSLFLRAAAESTDPEPNRTARRMLVDATRIDPDFGPAWAHLARRHYTEAQFGGGGERALRDAEAAAMRALKIDPDLISASRMLVTLKTERGELHEAWRSARELVERRPESADAHFSLSYVLRYAGLLSEAARECQTARALDPTSTGIRSCALVFLLAGDKQRAREFARLDEGSAWSGVMEIATLRREGRFEEAMDFGRTRQLDPYYWPVAKACYDKLPDREMRALVARVRKDLVEIRDPENAYFVSSVLAQCNQRDDALGLLRTAVERNYCAYPALDNDPELASLRDDPRFAQIRKAAMDCQKRFLEFRAQTR